VGGVPQKPSVGIPPAVLNFIWRVVKSILGGTQSVDESSGGIECDAPVWSPWDKRKSVEVSYRTKISFDSRREQNDA
jgi:hypothetical protein